MSEIRFACPHCGQRVTGDATYRGTEITCPACQKTLTVPAPAARAPLPQATGRISHLAVVSLTSSFALGIGSIPGIICGHLARARMRRDGSLRGKKIATAGLVLSYFFLLATIAFLTTGFFVLAPGKGKQLTAKEQEANTPAVMSARLVDEVKIADPDSEAAHNIKVRDSRTADSQGRKSRYAAPGGLISYEMKVDPERPMSLYCTYWGNADKRRFDIVVNDEVIATQALDFNDPGHFFDVEYSIPRRLTRGRDKVTVVFQAYPKNTAGGVYACQTLKR